MKVLSVGIHMDDCEYGMGGTAALLAEQGAEITFLNIKPYMHYTGRHAEADKQSERGAALVGAKKIILDYAGTKYYRTNEKTVRLTEDVIASIKPDIVFMMHPRDNHMEHVECARTTREALFAAAVDGVAPGEVYAYECGPLQTMQYFTPDFSIGIDPAREKVRASLCSYAAKHADGERLWHEKEVCAAFRGHPMGCSLAEAFRIIKFPDRANDFMLLAALRSTFCWNGTKMYYPRDDGSA